MKPDEVVEEVSENEERADDIVLRVRNLIKYFPVGKGVFRRGGGAVRAVDGVSFELRRGETLGIVGESGCGKSTLARLLMMLEVPTSGEIEFQGTVITGHRAKDLARVRRNIQMVFQDPYSSLSPRMTVEKIVGEAFDIHTGVMPRADRRAAIEELLRVVGLNPDHIDRYPHQFSGGQRQRIGIARGLALKPEVIICDEPVSALDVSVQAQVVNLLKDLQQDYAMSYVFIAHDLSVVRHIADRVAVMYLGRIVEIGTEDEIYERPTHPYTQALLSAIPVPDPRMQSRREQIVLQGDPPSPSAPPSGCRFRTRCWKATDICSQVEPELAVRPGTDHLAACHHPETHIGEPARVARRSTQIDPVPTYRPTQGEAHEI